MYVIRKTIRQLWWYTWGEKGIYLNRINVPPGLNQKETRLAWGIN